MLKRSFLVLSMIMVSSASIAGGKGVYNAQVLGYNQLLDDCGPSHNVGHSSIFGSPSEYQELYPKMGRLHAEIEAISKIELEDRMYANEKLADGKRKKDEIYLMSRDTNAMMNRNQNYIAATEKLLEDTMSKYGAQHDQLQKESNYVTDKAVGDVIEKLMEEDYKPGPHQPGPFYTDYDVWKTCVSWWAAGMPYYQTEEEEERNFNLNGWKNGQVTGEQYTEQSQDQNNSEVGAYEFNGTDGTRSPYEYADGTEANLVSEHKRVEADRWWDEKVSTSERPEQNYNVNTEVIGKDSTNGIQTQDKESLKINWWDTSSSSKKKADTSKKWWE